MQLQYLMPTLQGALACEDVRQEINGVQTLVGVLNVIPAPTLPIGLLKLCVWSRWCNGLGKFHQRSRILAPDDERIVAETTVDFQLNDLEAHATNVHFFAGVQFHETGVHHVELTLDGTLMLRFPLAVIKVTQSN